MTLTKGRKLYVYLMNKHAEKLFTERNLLIGLDLQRITDEEFDKVVNG